MPIKSCRKIMQDKAYDVKVKIELKYICIQLTIDTGS